MERPPQVGIGSGDEMIRGEERIWIFGEAGAEVKSGPPRKAGPTKTRGTQEFSQESSGKKRGMGRRWPCHKRRKTQEDRLKPVLLARLAT